MKNGRVNMLCNCRGMKHQRASCNGRVTITTDTHGQIVASNLVVIVDGCPNGPDPNLTLISNRQGYQIYAEGVKVTNN